MIDKYGKEYYLQEIYGDKREAQEIADFQKLVFRDSCNDFKNAAVRGSLIVGLYMISDEPCARLNTVDKNLLRIRWKILTQLYLHRKAFAPYLDPASTLCKRSG